MPRIVCRGLLIDMDGVLVDSTAAIARVWARWAARYNMDPIYVTAFAHGRTSRASIKDLLPHETPEVHLEEDLWMLRAEIEDIADAVALPPAPQLPRASPPCPLIPGSDPLTIEFPDSEIPRLPKMS